MQTEDKPNIMADLAAPADGTCMMRVLGKEGDVKTIWDPAKPDEVEVARDQFEKLVNQKRYVAFRVDRDGKQSKERMTAFDPKAGSIIIVPNYVGG